MDPGTTVLGKSLVHIDGLSSSFTIYLSFVWVALWKFCGWFSLDVLGLIIGLLFLISSPWVSNFFYFCFFLSLFGFHFIFHGHKIGRHLVLGTGNGAKTCTLLVIRFTTLVRSWMVGLWVMGLCSVPYELHESGTVLCVYWCFRTIGILISSLNWYILLISLSICLVSKKPHAVQT
ncbi:hypothetical protein EV426DRAFT_83136 [Tirmania nivea]|nr:hypothetical protein EV426DRAFT_83136 [Tirmania nivea]